MCVEDPFSQIRSHILNLTYHPKIHDIFTFMQEVIFHLPGDTQKKSAALSNFLSAIAAAKNKDSDSE